jgi:hypothetical protein
MESEIRDKPTDRRSERERAATRHRRNLRLRRERQEREPWEQASSLKLARANSLISDELDADPDDAARLRESRRQASEGKVRFWRGKDGGDQDGETGAGE